MHSIKAKTDWQNQKKEKNKPFDPLFGCWFQLQTNHRCIPSLISNAKWTSMDIKLAKCLMRKMDRDISQSHTRSIYCYFLHLGLAH